MIKSFPLFIISLLVVPVFLWLLVDRIQFVARAERVEGRVEEVRASNSSCGRRKSRRPCTKFNATISFVSNGGRWSSFRTEIGSARGHDQPLSRAPSRPGDGVPVLYDPTDISKACRDYFMDKWGAPLLALIFQVCTLLGSLTEKRRLIPAR